MMPAILIPTPTQTQAYTVHSQGVGIKQKTFNCGYNTQYIAHREQWLLLKLLCYLPQTKSIKNHTIIHYEIINVNNICYEIFQLAVSYVF